MSAFDLPLDQLRAYAPAVAEPADFDRFWADTLATSRAASTEPRFVPHETPLRTIATFDVTFSGYGGQAISGWLNVPVGRSEPLPTIVQYIGYGGGRSLPHEWLAWASAGYAHLVMDTRDKAGAGVRVTRPTSRTPARRRRPGNIPASPHAASSAARPITTAG